MNEQLYYKRGNRYVKIGPADYDSFHNMADGFWIIRTKVGSRSSSCVTKIADIPENVYDFGKIMVTADDLCTFIGEFQDECVKNSGGWGPSRWELSVNILKFLAKRAGLSGTYQFKEPERKIDLTL